jgi:hypothetical protein
MTAPVPHGLLIPSVLLVPRGRLMLPAHDQAVTHTYVVHYPEHAPRPGDPHYKSFDAYRAAHINDAKCVVGQHRNDYSDCCPGPADWPVGLELHHSVVEFSLMSGVDLTWLEIDYPGVSDPAKLDAWVESATNLEFRCVWHHRGAGGVHTVTASDYEGIKYVKGLTSAPTGKNT